MDVACLAPSIVVVEDANEAVVEQHSSHARTSSDSTPYCSDSEDDVATKTSSTKHKKHSKSTEKSAPVELTDDLKERLIAQAEFYLSDENLRKDGFLLKHVRRNKEGFVNLKLLSSFKKLKTISKDHNLVTEALKGSNQLAINEEGTKIRRIVPLPEDLCEKPPVKTVVVSRIPSDNPSMDFIAEALPSSIDEIVSMRIVRAGKKFPNDLQAHFARHPELHEDNVAIVEFESAQSAIDAVALDFSTSEKYNGMIVTLLELGSKLKIKRNKNDGGDNTDEEQSTRDGKSRKNKSLLGSNKKQDRIRQLTASGDEGSSAASYYSSSDGEQQMYSQRNGNRFIPQQHHNNSPRNSPVSSPQLQRYAGKKATPDSSPASSPRSSPWTRRRAAAATGSGNQSYLSSSMNGKDLRVSPLAKNKSPGSSPETRRKRDECQQTNGKPQSPWLARKSVLAEGANKTSPKNSPLLEIIRQPKGPDGTKGFHGAKVFQSVLPMEVAMS